MLAGNVKSLSEQLWRNLYFICLWSLDVASFPFTWRQWVLAALHAIYPRSFSPRRIASGFLYSLHVLLLPRQVLNIGPFQLSLHAFIHWQACGSFFQAVHRPISPGGHEISCLFWVGLLENPAWSKLWRWFAC